MKSIILSVGALSMILLTALFLQEQAVPNDFFLEARKGKAERENAEAEGYKAYMKSLRVNQSTGKLDPADVYESRAQARKLALQNNKTAQLPAALQWKAGGPDNIGGRSRAFFSDMNDPNKLYIGCVSGGFWISNDRGNNWTILANHDDDETLSISCITQTANGDIYYGTGEGIDRTPNYSEQPFIPGNGVYKSTDGGATFTQLTATNPPNNINSGAWTYVNEITAHPTNPDYLFAANNGGLYKTTDGGATWSKPTGLTGTLKMQDVEFSSTGNVVVASSSNRIFVSTDGGNTFGPNVNVNSATNDLPGTGFASRIAVAIAPSDENVMYAMLANNTGGSQGCYKSIDKGATWTQIAIGGSLSWDPLGGQGTYNMTLNVHPTKSEMIFVGGQLNLYRYTPQELWKPIAYANNSVIPGTYVHADMHGAFFNSGNPDEMYVVTDGGFFRTEDCTVPYPGNPFFIEKNKNYSTAQCYSVAANRLGHIMFGSQDNGSNIMRNTIANSAQTSERLLGGDGMDCILSDYNVNFVFGESQYGGLRRATDGGAGPASFTSMFDINVDPDDDGDHGITAPGPATSNWVAPLHLNETATNSVFMFGLINTVWFTQGATELGQPIWFPLITQNGAGFSAVTTSKDGKVAYVGTRSGKVYRISNLDLLGTRYKYDSTDNKFDNSLPNSGFTEGAGFVVTDIETFSGRHITDLETDETGDLLLVTLPNYGNNRYVYKSTNARTAANPSFTSIQGNLPFMPVYTVAMLKDPNQDTYLVGTEMGVWGTDDGGTTWTNLNNHGGNVAEWHPNVPTMEIMVKDTREIINGNGLGWAGEIIYTGTHGRGTFYSTTLATGWANSVDETKRVESKLDVYPNPIVNTANISIDTEYKGSAILNITSLNGRVVKSEFLDITSGSNNLAVDMQGLSKGVYIVSLNMGGTISTAKVIKR